MHRTIFDTPVVNTLLRAFSVTFLRLTGWKVEGALPPECAKSVFIAAPHTSNWDLPYTLMVCFAPEPERVLDGQDRDLSVSVRRHHALARRHFS